MNRRSSKFAIYEQQQIRYYLIVGPDTEEVEVYMLENQIYQLKQSGRNFAFDFSLDSDCVAQINFKEIW